MPQSLDFSLFLGLGIGLGVGSSSVPGTEATTEPEVPKGREGAMDLETFLRRCGVEPPVERTTGEMRKRMKKAGNEGEVGGVCGGDAGGDLLLQDPLEVLGRDLMMKILSNLDARSVALSLVVSCGWHGVASSDSLWSIKV
uniref:Uncharacterized protein LOC107408595 n=1 Tax=Rhizophora mucronata TaxID=61149 RepID=A0A2P2KYI9_RHIMU